ncbi:hypothetical protein [Luedemannella helvata]|uniref:Uncharacterized protein n=1 Tax=Luedemannella helvata TaxID=349315 RepID=A0ABP4X4K6_9ACTN
MSIATDVVQRPMEAFPPEPELEHERSELSLPLVVDGEVKEVIRMESLLKMQRSAPVLNAAGVRQFEFIIVEWEVAGFCETLGDWVQITLSPNIPQPKSVCVSQQHGSDYPAIIVYNAIMDVYLGKRLVDPQYVGLAVGADVMQIPPRNHVHFQKAFNLGEGLDIMSASCATMASMPPEEWETKATEFRRLRAN